MTPDTDPLPTRGVIDVPAFEAGTHLDGDRIVGCWFLDRFDVMRASGDDVVPPSVRWDVVRTTSNLQVIRCRRTDGRAPAPRLDPQIPGVEGQRSAGKTFQHFVRTMRDAAALIGAPAPDGAPTERKGFRHAPLPFRMAGLGDEFLARCAASLATALDALSPFLATLDPVGIAHALDDMIPAEDHGIYRRLDATLDPAAPLARALALEPLFPRLLVAASGHVGAAMARDVAEGRDGVRALVREVLRASDSKRGRRGHADLVTRVADAWAGLEPDVLRDLSHVVVHRGSPTDPVVVAAGFLEPLPLDWMPRDAEGWSAFARCSSALRHVSHKGPHAAALLDAKADWPRLLRRLCKAAGRGPHDLGSALQGIGDVQRAYETEVMGPAQILSQSRRGAFAQADGILTDGRRLCAQLEDSRRWHAGRGRILATIARFPHPEAPAEWPEAWPAFAHGGVTLRELTTRRALTAEGDGCPDEDGVEGLDHCVGGYSGSCLTGRSRVVGLRAADGSRLSTAELSWDAGDGTVGVIQHQGRGNGSPTPEAAAALAAYVRAVEAGGIAVRTAALAPVPGGGDRWTPYDVLAPGAWEAVRDAWDPFVPRRFRGLTSRELTRVRRATSPRGSVEWLPEPATLGP